MPPKPKPHDKEVVRRVEKARPGATATEPTFEAIIEAILDADPKTVREHKTQRRSKDKTYATSEYRKRGNDDPNIKKPKT